MKTGFRIGEWEIRPQLNCVSQGSKEIHVEPKVMHVLLELCAHPGDVVSKDALIQSVWRDTFVGDDALIRCISQLRRIFNDDARTPKFIQTIPKVGYRLIAQVSPLGEPAAASGEPSGNHRNEDDGTQVAVSEAVTPEQLVDRVTPTAPVPGLAPSSATLPAGGGNSVAASGGHGGGHRMVAGVIAVVCALAIVSWVFLALYPQKVNGTTHYRTVPVTSYPGTQDGPAFSPDGKQIAFSWNGTTGDTTNIYVKTIGSEDLKRLTFGPGEDLNPQWSPDGTQIAFIRHSETDSGIYVVPTAGGPERKVHELNSSVDVDTTGLSWSPDGKRLAFPDGKSQELPSAIMSLSLDTLKTEQITNPPNSWDGDFSPAFSPDGSSIAFIRGPDVGVRHIYVMAASGGEPKRLTTDASQVFGLTWAPDSSAIVFSSDRGGSPGLWRVSVHGGRPERLAVGTENAMSPAISKDSHLVYSQGSAMWSIMRVDLKSGHGKNPASPLFSSTEQDSAAKYAPDGRRIAFQSRRSGAQEIWTCDSNGKNLSQLTSFDGPLTGSPSWSPDGRQIAFDSRVNGRSHIFVISSTGGKPRALTQGNDYNDIIPNWSRDGQHVYFASKRGGAWQVWRASLTGEIQQMTRDGGYVAQESADGKWIYYTKYDVSGLWRKPSSGVGDETKVLDGPPSQFWGYWVITGDGIYFLDNERSHPSLDYYSFATRQITKVHELQRRPPAYSGMSVSPDNRWLLYLDQRAGNNLVLVENFK